MLMTITNNLVATAMIILFFIGICGNLWVLTLISVIFRTKQSNFSNNHVLIYLMCLSIVDTCVLILIPFITTNAVLNKWIFGAWWCKISFGIEGINKLCTTFIMTAMAFDRYVAVCHPRKLSVRNWRVAIGVVIVCGVAASFLLYPPLYFTVLYKGRYCITQWSGDWLQAFSFYVFVIGFVCPGIAIAVFYTLIIRKLSKHTRSMNTTQISMKKVTTSTLMIVGFYFGCWTPYWIYQLTLLNSATPSTDQFVKFYIAGKIVNSLPFINAGLNWIFYAYLNKSLRGQFSQATVVKEALKQHSRTVSSTLSPTPTAKAAFRSFGHTTAGGGGFRSKATTFTTSASNHPRASSMVSSISVVGPTMTSVAAATTSAATPGRLALDQPESDESAHLLMKSSASAGHFQYIPKGASSSRSSTGSQTEELEFAVTDDIQQNQQMEAQKPQNFDLTSIVTAVPTTDNDNDNCSLVDFAANDNQNDNHNSVIIGQQQSDLIHFR